MKQEFLKPYFAGPRFDEHTLPVELGRDLAAYEELVVELAKHLYLLEHPKRKRVPRGFEGSFSLHFQQVEGGSARPVLAWVTAGVLALQPVANANAAYFEQARDLIADCVKASADGVPLPNKFPKHLLGYFDTFGRSLHEGESIDIAVGADGGGGGAVLTPQRRKELVLAAQHFYRKDVKLQGMIAETDWEKKTLRLRLQNGASITAHFTDDFETKVRDSGGRERTLTQLAGIGVFDAWDRMIKVEETKHLVTTPNYELVTRFEELQNVQDGWWDGQGVAPEKEQLSWIAEQFVTTYPEDLPFPLVAPTPEGGLFLEWFSDSQRISADFSLQDANCELQVTDLGTGASAEHLLNIEGEQQMSELYALLRQHLPQVPAAE